MVTSTAISSIVIAALSVCRRRSESGEQRRHSDGLDTNMPPSLLSEAMSLRRRTEHGLPRANAEVECPLQQARVALESGTQSVSSALLYESL